MRTLLLALLAAGCWGAAQAQVPNLINYQGTLTNPGGQPINATVPMVFNLYSVSAGGSTLYTESHSVIVNGGVFNVAIGSVTPLALAFDVPYYLGIAVGADAEMTPRQAVLSSAYSLRAANANALSPTATVAGAQITGTVSAATMPTSQLTGTIGTAQIADNAVTQAKLSPTTGAAPGKVLGTDGTNLVWQAAGGGIPTGCGTAPLTLGTPTYTSPAGVGGVVYKGDAVSFAVSVTNPNTCSGFVVANKYLWTLLSGPAGSSAALSNPAAASPVLVADVAGGTYQLSVQVTDTLGNASPTKVVSVNVSACGGQAPVASVAPPTLTTYTSTSSILTLSASSPDNQNANPGLPNYCPARFAKTLSYKWSLASAPVDGNAQLGGVTTLASTFAAGTVPGSYQVTAVVTDNAGLSSPPITVPITVQLCGTAPLSWPPANAVVVSFVDPDPSATSLNVGTQVSLTPNVINPNTCPGATVTNSFVWTQVSAPPGSAAPLVNKTSPVALFVPDVMGTYQFQVTASDSLGNTSPPQLASVTTSACGANPISAQAVATASAFPVGTTVGNPVIVSTGTAVALGLKNGSASSADNSPGCPARFAQTFTYAWSIVNAPPGSTAQLTNVDGSTTTFNTGAAPGYYQVQVVARGSSGMSSPASYVYLQLP